MANKKRGLGRGLDALLSASKTDSTDNSSGDKTASASASNEDQVRHIPVEHIQRGKYQPRRDMEPESLQELADSIAAQGIMQPIVVRPVSKTTFEIIAGERRWRAAQMAGLETVPCLVRDVPDETAIALALIENIQRENLNPVEEAVALQRLQDEFELTQKEVAQAVGKSRSTVTNLLRLLSLNKDVRILLERGDMEMGHAKALLALEGGEQSEAARHVVGKGLSVRQTEAYIRALKKQQGDSVAKDKTIDPNIRSLQDELSGKLGSPVHIDHRANGKGKLTISYASLDQLDGILSHIK